MKRLVIVINNNILKYLLLIFMINSCITEPSSDELKKEILDIENSFMEMVQREGISNAFSFYAAKDAVILRNNKIIKGKESIYQFYHQKSYGDNITLTWNPDYIDVSKSGDLAYTYGKYFFSNTDENGEKHVNEGIFHTVWKKQENGEWKFVWD